MRNSPPSRIEGAVAPLLRANIDTDAIAPSRNRISPDTTDFSSCLFSEWRFDENGAERPDFVLNEPARRDVAFLIALDNFGCGSSRETAPWALRDYGLRCLVAPSFGSIFQNNCYRNGIAPVVLPRAVVERFGNAAEADPALKLTLDLPSQTLSASNGLFAEFDIDHAGKKMLIEGLDPIGLTLLRRAEIDAFRAADRMGRPWAYASHAA